MSQKLQTLVWETDLPQGRKLLLLSIADQAHENGEAYPGIPFLMQRCGMGRSTVFTALGELEAEGYISRRALPGGKTMYRVERAKLAQADLLKPEKQSRFKTRPESGRVQNRDESKNKTRPESQENPRPDSGLHKSNQEQDQKQPGVCDAGAHASDRVGSFEPNDTPPDSRGTPQGRAAAALNRAGVKVTSMDPDLIAACAEGVTVEHLLELADVHDGKPAKYLIATARRLRAEQAAPVLARSGSARRGGAPPGPRANDDLTGARYQGTPDHDLPPELR